MGHRLLSPRRPISTPRPIAAIRRAFLILVFVCILGGLWICQDSRSTISLTSKASPSRGHPIENLIISSQAQFYDMLSRQSKTLDEAVGEYERRYGRRPPLGFDQWYSLAVENEFVLIDEFDTLMESLEPFHGVHPSILEQRITQVLESDAHRMVVMEFANGNVTISDNMRETGEKLTNKAWLGIVPYNMTVVLNEFDEPMVSAPFEEVVQAVYTAKHHERHTMAQKPDQTIASPIVETGEQSGWAATAHACPKDSASRQPECSQRELITQLSFVSNITSSKDVCQNCELLQQEGILLSPKDMRLVRQLVPVWSTSKPSHFHDILYPSAYYNGIRLLYELEKDLAWKDKDNKFYWVGGDTGGLANEDTWNRMQRQRLVLKTAKTNTEAVQLLEEVEPGSDSWTPRFSTMAEVRDLFSTRIVDLLQCTDDACEIEKEAFGLEQDVPLDPQEVEYSYKFLLDIDGNGFSGRFYRLLESKSVVVKQTIFKEWHDDRLVPWVHYVPLSTGYSELPEMARFLATTERGLELSERIARESTEWYHKALRDVDLRLVFLRMLLEYGRIMNPDMTG